MSNGSIRLSWPEASDDTATYRLDIYNSRTNDSGDIEYVCVGGEKTSETQLVLSNLEEDVNYYAVLHSLSETELLGTYKYANIYIDSGLDYYSEENIDTVINRTEGNGASSNHNIPKTGERSNIEIVLLIFVSAAILITVSAYKIQMFRKER